MPIINNYSNKRILHACDKTTSIELTSFSKGKSVKVIEKLIKSSDSSKKFLIKNISVLYRRYQYENFLPISHPLFMTILDDIKRERKKYTIVKRIYKFSYFIVSQSIQRVYYRFKFKKLISTND
jgi:hypothetical protein